MRFLRLVFFNIHHLTDSLAKSLAVACFDRPRISKHSLWYPLLKLCLFFCENYYCLRTGIDVTPFSFDLESFGVNAIWSTTGCYHAMPSSNLHSITTCMCLCFLLYHEEIPLVIGVIRKNTLELVPML